MASSPMSSLSALSSEDFPEDVRNSDRDVSDDNDSIAIRPSKRRRTTHPTRSPHIYDSPTMAAVVNEATDWTDISSDTSGSVPGSPRTLKDLSMADEASMGSDQVRVCSWDGCNLGDLGNVDELVQHLNEDHVGAAKKTKYTCEWTDCKAKGKTQMSAYALKAHLRSHTKEKPFYCMLPECDRSFTRSDALAKHMRTVHETESPRTIDHYGRYGHPIPTTAPDATPRGTSPQPPPSASATGGAPPKPPARLKLVLSSNKISSPLIGTDTDNADNAAPTSPLSPITRDNLFGPLPPELEFDEAEAALPRDELFRLLRRQVHWATQESALLAVDIARLEKERKQEWMGKELLLENTLEAELATMARRGIIREVRNRGVDVEIPDGVLLVVEEREVEQGTVRAAEGKRVVDAMLKDQGAANRLPMEGREQPWYRSSQWKEEIEAKTRDSDERRVSLRTESEGDGEGEGDGEDVGGLDVEDQGDGGADDTEVEVEEDGA